MPIDPSIPLAGNTNIPTPPAESQLPQLQQRQLQEQRLQRQEKRQAKLDERQAEKDRLQAEKTQLEIEKQQIDNLDTQRKAELRSVIMGASQVLPLITGDNPNIGLAKEVLNRRNQGLVETGRDNTDTQEALTILNRGDAGEISQLAQQMKEAVSLAKRQRQLFTDFGDLPSTVQTADILVTAEDQGNLRMADAIREIAKTQEKGFRVRGGQLEVTPGTTQAVTSLERAKKTGSLEAEKTLKPQIEKEVVSAKKGAELIAEKKRKMPKARSAMNLTFANMDRAIEKIDSVLPRVNRKTAGFLGSKLEGTVLGQEATDLSADLDTIKAIGAFETLGEIKRSSPTGGGLGATSDNEIRLLGASKANLENVQSPEQLTRNLTALREDIVEAKKRLQVAFDEDFEELSQPTATDGITILPDESETGGLSQDELAELEELEKLEELGELGELEARFGNE